MQFTHLGRTSMTISRLCLGTKNLHPLTAEELQHQPGDVARAWLLAQPTVTPPVIGPRTAEQLEPTQRSLDVELDQKSLERLDDTFAGHKTASEDYAR